MNTMINIDVERGVTDMTTKMMVFKISEEEFILTTSRFIEEYPIAIAGIINTQYPAETTCSSQEVPKLFKPFDLNDYSDNAKNVISLLIGPSFDWSMIPIFSFTFSKNYKGVLNGGLKSLYIRK